MKKNMHLLRGLGIDLIVWFSAPAIFLYLYTSRYLISTESVLPHLRLMLLILLVLIFARMVLSKFIDRRSWLYALMGILGSTLLSAMLLYYSLVLVGLESWGRVISWDLITSYVKQAPELASTVGIPLPLVVCLTSVAYVLLLTAACKYFKSYDWTLGLSNLVSNSLFAFLIFATLAIISLETWRIKTNPAVHAFEPVALTLFPMEASRNFQNNPIDYLSAARLDLIEDTTRASYQTNLSGQRKNIILIVVDALRPDHMGIYGYARDTTPNLNRIEKTGAILKEASMHASCSESACGLLSISSSKFVHQFSNKPFTLQEALKRHGYRIHMILSGDHANFYGLKDAYGDVDTYFDGSMARGRYVNDDRLVLDKLESLPEWNGVPVMMQLHLMSSHILGKRFAEAEKFQPASSYIALKALGRAETDREPDQLAVNHYDNGVFQTDMMIGKVLENLQKKGYLQDAVAVVTADHGELLGEHGLFSHGNSVYEEALRIPFLMIRYGYQARSFSKKSGFTSQVDIAPTLLAEVGVPRPRSWAGSPLQEDYAQRNSFFQQGVFAGLFDWNEQGYLWKYWINKNTEEEMAFNMTLDPKEGQNRIKDISQQLRHEWLGRLDVFSKANTLSSQ